MRHLHQQQSYATRRRMHQRGFAPLQRIGLVRQVVRSHTLQHGGCRFALAHALRNPHQPISGHCGILGIATQRAAPGHAVTCLHGIHVRAHGRDHARALLSGDEGQRRLVSTLAKVDINKVDARSRNLHHRLVRFGLRDRQVHKLKSLRPPGLFHLDSFHEKIGFLTAL